MKNILKEMQDFFLFDSFSLSAMCFALIKNLLDYVDSKSGCLLEKIAEKFSEFYLQKFSAVENYHCVVHCDISRQSLYNIAYLFYYLLCLTP